MICKDCKEATDLELGAIDGTKMTPRELKVTINGHRRCARRNGTKHDKRWCDCQHRGWL